MRKQVLFVVCALFLTLGSTPTIASGGEWSIVDSPMDGDGQLSDPSSDITDFSATVVGMYTVEVLVSDDTESAAPVQVMIDVQDNNAPVASVSLSESTGFVGLPIGLDGSMSFDPDGRDLTYMWSFVEQPEGSDAVIDWQPKQPCRCRRRDRARRPLPGNWL